MLCRTRRSAARLDGVFDMDDPHDINISSELRAEDVAREAGTESQPAPEGTPCGGNTPRQPESGLAETSYEELVYRQELSEVFLLLDFISGRPDKRLSDLDNKIAGWHNEDKDKLRSAEIIARVSRMRYPAHAQNGERAKEAAFLLQAKDWLNWLAYPARGLTIAYTTMFSEGSNGLGHGIWNRIFHGRSAAEAKSSRVEGATAARSGGLVKDSGSHLLFRRSRAETRLRRAAGVRIEPQPADRSQGARRRPPGVRNRPGRRGGHRPSTSRMERPQRASGARRARLVADLSSWSSACSRACSSVMALSPPTTMAAASASRRARPHRAIACRNACRAGVSSRVWGASRTARGSAWNSAKVHFIAPAAIDENSLCQSYHLHRQPSVHAPKGSAIRPTITMVCRVR